MKKRKVCHLHRFDFKNEIVLKAKKNNEVVFFGF